jgi:hypothetical protein
VAIYAVDSGKGTEFLERLQDDGLRNGSTVNPKLVAIFVSFNDRYSEIRYGDQWVGALGNAAGHIQQDTLNANLAAGNSTQAFALTLTQLNNAIASPAPAGGGTAGAPVDTGLIPWCLGILAAVGLGTVGWRALSQRRAAGQVLDRARAAMQEARLKAGAAIADTAQLLKNVQEKAQYDKISYAADDVAQLAEQQRQGEQQFVAAQEQFNAADEEVSRLKEPAEAQYQAATARYQEIAQLATQAQQLLQQTEARRSELDAVNAQAPDRVEQAKKALADAAERLGVLGEQAQVDAILRPIEQQLSRAESLLAEHRAAASIDAAEAASAAAVALAGILARFADLREGLNAGRAAAERATTQGYRVEAGLRAFDAAEQDLGRAALALSQGGVDAAAPILDVAEAARAEGVARGGSLPATHDRNELRVPELRGELEQVAAYIGEGRRTFDVVDEFAPSTWSDIRGNGSEAEAAHAAAAQLIDSAVARNTMERQEIVEASQDLDAAAERLGFARTLIDSIMQRLKDLEAARAAARDEVEAAQHDIEQGQSFVQSHDPDIGAAPPDELVRAAGLLQQATAELQQERPDWLQVVKLAQQANQLADQALAEARSEVEQIVKLRQELERARTVAQGEVQKLAQFVQIHGNELPPESRQRLGALNNDVQLADRAAASVQRAEDQARIAALREAIEQYTALQGNAGQVYAAVYQAFQRVDALRQQLQSRLTEAQNAIMRADGLRRSLPAGAGRRGDALLGEAQSLLSSLGSLQTERQMQAGLERAERAISTARQAESAYEQEINTWRRSGRSGDDLLTGMIIGQVLGGGHHGGGHRGGGSWGGGSWGGGGSSGGGSWGGGGSSGGGSWGGGGSSGGSGW